MSFNDDFDWQRGLIPEAKRILANYLIGEAPMDEDIRRNTDLIVLTMEPLRIACRFRRPDYVQRYSEQFTIRASRKNGVDTELAKVLSGWGDFLFYAFAAPDDGFSHWLLGSLSVFRLWHHREMLRCNGQLPGYVKRNKDGSSEFVAYRVTDLPSDFVIARNPGALSGAA